MFVRTFLATIVSFGLAVSVARADQVSVLAVETDAFVGTSYIEVVRDESDALTGMVYRSHDGRTLNLSLDQLRSGPQVVKEMDGHKVIFLSVEGDFTAERGGHLSMRYLYSGISGSYRNFRVLVDVAGSQIVLRSDPNRNDRESDRNRYTSVFNYLFLQKNTFWGKTIGIEAVIPEVR